MKNIYSHTIRLTNLTIKNAPRVRFRKSLEAIEYLGYLVDTLADGRQIVITKPGGKRSYGRPRREDFMVWIRNRKDNSLWLISHDDIYQDIKEKAQEDRRQAVRLICALEKVYKGKEPKEALRRLKHRFTTGESPELLLEAYKWIWGQEDCNYPTGQGRAMSMSHILKYKNLLKTLLAKS